MVIPIDSWEQKKLTVLSDSVLIFAEEMIDAWPLLFGPHEIELWGVVVLEKYVDGRVFWQIWNSVGTWFFFFSEKKPLLIYYSKSSQVMNAVICVDYPNLCAFEISAVCTFPDVCILNLINH